MMCCMPPGRDIYEYNEIDRGLAYCVTMLGLILLLMVLITIVTIALLFFKDWWALKIWALTIGVFFIWMCCEWWASEL